MFPVMIGPGSVPVDGSATSFDDEPHDKTEGLQGAATASQDQAKRSESDDGGDDDHGNTLYFLS